MVIVGRPLGVAADSFDGARSDLCREQLLSPARFLCLLGVVNNSGGVRAEQRKPMWKCAKKCVEATPALSHQARGRPAGTILVTEVGRLVVPGQ